MNIHGLVLLGILLSSFLTGVVIFFLKEESHRLRTWLNLLGAGLKLILVAALLWGIYQGQTYSLAFDFLPGIQFALGADANSVLFVTLSSFLWFWTTLYAVGYLEDSPHRSRFFGFFSLCVTATTGIALSANLVTFLVFYELLTVSTYPLVVHRGTPEAMRGGKIYLAYTLVGGTVLLLAVAWLHHLAGPVMFKERGVIQALMATHRGELQILFLLFMLGIGVKAAIVPLHGWLPKAMVAPAPVSSLLHAVAVVKAGAFGIVRIVYDVYGVENAAKLGVLQPLAIAAGMTIIYGSVLALFQDELKKRLAFSTVSQVSYIVLGVAILGPAAAIGGLVHLVHQGLMKITLFFGAGNYAETLGHSPRERDERRRPTDAANHRGLHGRCSGHDWGAVPRRRRDEEIPQAWRRTSRRRLGGLGVDCQQLAQCSVLPADPVASLDEIAAGELATRTQLRQMGDAVDAAAAPAGDRGAGSMGRPVRQLALQPLGVGEIDCGAGIRTLDNALAMKRFKKLLVHLDLEGSHDGARHPLCLRGESRY